MGSFDPLRQNITNFVTLQSQIFYFSNNKTCMSRKMQTIFTFSAIMILWSVISLAQSQNISAAFYNVQNLFDTIDSPLVYDSDFTPEGRYGWNSARYAAKIKDVARVIDDLGVDVIALAEVENEGVVRDLVRAINIDYAYFHYNSLDSRGIDIAMLYRPERLFIDSTTIYKISGHNRELITLFGTIDQRPVVFSGCHLPSAFNSDKKRMAVARQAGKYFGSIAESNPLAACIFVGDFNFELRSKQMKEILKAGSALVSSRSDSKDISTYIYGDKRVSFDHALVNKEIENTSHSYIFIRDYLVDYSLGKQMTIRPTYSKGVYMSGTSDHLPIVIMVEN